SGLRPRGDRKPRPVVSPYGNRFWSWLTRKSAGRAGARASLRPSLEELERREVPATTGDLLSFSLADPYTATEGTPTSFAASALLPTAVGGDELLRVDVNRGYGSTLTLTQGNGLSTPILFDPTTYISIPALYARAGTYTLTVQGLTSGLSFFGT